jgi:hypothetical protein
VLKGLSVVALVASGAGLWAYPARDVTTSLVVPAAHESATEGHVAQPAEGHVVQPAEAVTTDVAGPERTPLAEHVAPARTGTASQKDTARPGTGPRRGASPSTIDAPPPPSSEPLPSPESRLSDEAHAVLAARAALRSGNPGAALRELSAASALFPGGALVQEREALTIEALARSGQSGAASARAQAFLRRFPRSPHADDVRRFIVAP